MSQETNNTDVAAMLKEAVGELLTQETLDAIQEAFQSGVEGKAEELAQLRVEKALVEQDEDHAEKLERLLEAIDKDHSNKLNKVLKAVNENHAYKMQQVVKKYSKDVVEEAEQFKQDLVTRVSDYLDLYIENHIPTEDIKQAVQNKQAAKQLHEMRKFLAVNHALGQDSIKHAIKDGKRQIDESTQAQQQLAQENDALKQQLISEQREKLLAQKTKNLPAQKTKYLNRVFADKPVEFINENFDYMLKMFEKTEEDKLEQAKKQASSSRPAIDRPKAVVTESKQTEQQSKQFDDPFGYMNELSKF